jgi:hypothetical protein
MAAGLDSLHDHRVHARRSGGLRLGDRPDLNEHLDAVSMRVLHERRRIPPGEDEHGRTLLDHHLDLLVDERRVFVGRPGLLELRDDHAHAKWPVGQLPNAGDQPPDLLAGHTAAAQHAAATRR